MREFTLPIIVTVMLLGTLLIFGYQYATPKLEPYLENKITGMVIGDIGIDLTIADTPKKRELGLSGLRQLPGKAGLLIVFDRADYHGIWMKDMNFPIDIIWIDDTLTIVDITESLNPDSFPAVFEPKVPARMALEVNALFAATYEIEIGQTVRIAPGYLPEDLKGN